MNKISGKLTVFFDGAFWIGVFEETIDDELRAAKVTFGQEPKESEILSFLFQSYHQISFSPSVSTRAKPVHHSPKRMQREVRRQMEAGMNGTKSQQAIKLQQEQKKLEKTKLYRESRERDQANRFAEKQRKKKAKHRGH